MGIVSSLLLHGPNSPLYQALIASNIGLDYSPGTGYESWRLFTLEDIHFRKESSFGVGLSGIREEDIPVVEETIDQTLRQTAKDGFDPKEIESILHQLEISQKHVSESTS